MTTDIRLGEYRESMATNPLLRKASLGKPMQRGFDLPGDHFIYGRPNHCIDGGAQEAMQYAFISKHKAIENANLKANKKCNKRVNIIKRNKIAIQQGLVNAREQACAKQELTAAAYQIHPPTNTVKSNNQTSLPPNMTFGISTRPSTPVFELLEHRYQSKWLQGQQKRQLQTDECAKNSAAGKIKKTQANFQKACKSFAKRCGDRKGGSYQKDWQMSKWAAIGPHLETFRSDAVRERSFATHNSTKNSRRGVFGHGIYIE